MTKISTDDDDYMRQMEIQRKAFESQFGSLESMGYEDKSKVISKGSNSEDEHTTDIYNDEDYISESSEGDSSSSDNDKPQEIENTLPNKSTFRQPKVIKFNETNATYVAPSKEEQKMLRSGKTLSSVDKRKALLEEKNSKKHKTTPEEEKVEAENLQNDVELQQFLQESHLLSAFNSTSTSSSGVSLTLESMGSSNSESIAYQDDEVSGKARLRTLEMRLNRISKVNGHEKKINKLEKVPMHIRKGMVDKHVQRIRKYEKDAAEGGIILSKVKKGQFRKIESTYKKDIERRIGNSIKSKDEERNARRERGLKINTIGRSTRNGLIVSKDEIARIGGSSNFSKGNRGKKSFGGNRGGNRGRKH